MRTGDHELCGLVLLFGGSAVGDVLLEVAEMPGRLNRWECRRLAGDGLDAAQNCELDCCSPWSSWGGSDLVEVCGAQAVPEDVRIGRFVILTGDREPCDPALRVRAGVRPLIQAAAGVNLGAAKKRSRGHRLMVARMLLSLGVKVIERTHVRSR